ncbi:MAG: thiolase family protein [Phycisphaerales bacterium]|nr:MAG: thiolase family protein [Phycisphaerales bacterium]
MKRDEYPHVVIAGAARTPVGLKCGTLSNFSAEDLGVLAAEEAIRRSGVGREKIDTAIGANVYQYTAPGCQDIYFPRNVALRCHLNTETPGLMVQRICGSGLQTVINALQQIALPDVVDDTKIALCVGAETMSRVPQVIRAPRRSGPSFWEFVEGGEVEDMMLAGLNHDLAETAMMITADEYGTQMGVTRQDCDEFAGLSHSRARAAYRSSHFNGGDALRGIFAIDASDLTGNPVHLARDECVRQTSADVLAKLPGFTPNGLISPGNASEISDGAAALVVAGRAEAEKQDLPTRYEVAGYGVAGVEPRVMGRGPVPAIKQALDRAGLEQKDIGLWEINEAFAAQYLGVEKELNLDRETTNVNGGAVAIGHPLAATGARLLTDLMYEMERRDVHYGCASACIGGGQGVAVVIRDTEKTQ